MRRESWFAILLTLMLACAGAGWLFMNAADFADPGAGTARGAGPNLPQDGLLRPPRLYEATLDDAVLNVYVDRAVFTRPAEVNPPRRFQDAPPRETLPPQPETPGLPGLPGAPSTITDSAPNPNIGGSGGDARPQPRSPQFRAPPPPGYLVRAIFPDGAWVQVPGQPVAKFSVGDRIGDWRVARITAQEVFLERGDAFTSLAAPEQ